ncbi:MAG: hypothetical protein E6Q06_01890 [Candidatus Moraniibacteriota bacterium]|nr:MAG: hypothetical protein E6Q06_01890 [Candidatus Moranbacteria bacterium]
MSSKEICEFYESYLTQIREAREQFLKSVDEVIAECNETRAKYMRGEPLSQERWARIRGNTSFSYKYSLDFNSKEYSNDFLIDKCNSLDNYTSFYQARKRKSMSEIAGPQKKVCSDAPPDAPIPSEAPESVVHEAPPDAPVPSEESEVHEAAPSYHFAKIEDDDTYYSDDEESVASGNSTQDDYKASELSEVKAFFVAYKSPPDVYSKEWCKDEKLAVILEEQYPLTVENQVSDLYGEDERLRDYIEKSGRRARIVEIAVNVDLHAYFGRLDEITSEIYFTVETMTWKYKLIKTSSSLRCLHEVRETAPTSKEGAENLYLVHACLLN